MVANFLLRKAEVYLKGREEINRKTGSNLKAPAPNPKTKRRSTSKIFLRPIVVGKAKGSSCCKRWIADHVKASRSKAKSKAKSRVNEAGNYTKPGLQTDI